MYLIDDDKITFIQSITIERWNDSETYALKINGEPIVKNSKSNLDLLFISLVIGVEEGLNNNTIKKSRIIRANNYLDDDNPCSAEVIKNAVLS